MPHVTCHAITKSHRSQAAAVAPGALGELIGFSGALDNVARVLSPLIGSWVLDRYGTQTVGTLASALAVYSTLPLAAAFRSKNRTAEASHPKDKDA